MQLSRLIKSAGLASTLWVTALSSTANGQTSASTAPTSASRNALFISPTIGPASLQGGEYRDRAEVALDVLVGLRRMTSSRFSPVAGIVLGGMEGAFGHDAVCQISAKGGCVRAAPNLRYAVLVGGINVQENRLSITALAGPGAIRVASDDAGNFSSGGSTTVYGTLLRGDLWVNVVRHLEVGGSVATRILPSFRHESIQGNSISTGVRLTR